MHHPVTKAEFSILSTRSFSPVTVTLHWGVNSLLHDVHKRLEVDMRNTGRMFWFQVPSPWCRSLFRVWPGTNCLIPLFSERGVFSVDRDFPVAAREIFVQRTTLRREPTSFCRGRSGYTRRESLLVSKGSPRCRKRTTGQFKRNIKDYEVDKRGTDEDFPCRRMST